MSNSEQLKARFLDLNPELSELIRDNIPGWAGNHHRFDKAQVSAIQAAWFADRPLLVRGDPGLGKSQLAPALATYLNFKFYNFTIHADTEISDLLYRTDHIERLSDSQVSNKGDSETEKKKLHDYVYPGVLWQAIARNKKPEFQKDKEDPLASGYQGSLVLIDEIDKADASLPNALLEVLNNKTITVSSLGQVIKQDEDHPVFVVITSNDDRALPPAFLRRCAILDLRLKSEKEGGVEQLMRIYQVHKRAIESLSEETWVEDQTVEEIAIDVIKHRDQQKRRGEYAPGTSEFLDLLRAFSHYAPGKRDKIKDNLFKALVRKQGQIEAGSL